MWTGADPEAPVVSFQNPKFTRGILGRSVPSRRRNLVSLNPQSHLAKTPRAHLYTTVAALHSSTSIAASSISFSIGEVVSLAQLPFLTSVAHPFPDLLHQARDIPCSYLQRRQFNHQLCTHHQHPPSPPPDVDTRHFPVDVSAFRSKPPAQSRGTTPSGSNKELRYTGAPARAFRGSLPEDNDRIAAAKNVVASTGEPCPVLTDPQTSYSSHHHITAATPEC